MKRFSRFFLCLLIIAIVLRIIVALFSFQLTQNTDVLRYRDWARISFLYDLKDSYGTEHLSFGTLPNNQPPGSLYILSGMFRANIELSKIIYRVTETTPGELEWVNGALTNFMLRLPSILGDIGIAIFIYLIVNQFTKRKEKLALISSSIFLFNPIVIYNSAFWGQMDSLNNFFFILSIWLIINKKYFLSIFSLFVSLYIKLSLIYFLPVFLLYAFYKKKVKAFYYSLISFFALMIFTFPISNNPFSWFFSFIKTNGAGEMKNITASAFNIWWVIFSPVIKSLKNDTLFNFSDVKLYNSPLDSYSFLSLSLGNWGIIIFLAVYCFILFYFYKSKNKKAENVFLLLSLIALISFLFLPRMHNRYMYPVFPLLAIYTGILGKGYFIYSVLAILNFLNVYITWHPFRIPGISFNVLNNQFFQWAIALITVLSGIYLLMYYLVKIKNND